MSRTSRNNKQKGRKHRRVNRTPRPVTPVDRRKDGPGRAPAAVRAPAEAARPAAMVPRPAAGVEQALADGLSRHAQRTLTCLHDSGSAGATTEDLSEAVGFTARTVAKHLDGLSRCGLVEQDPGGRWSATDPAPVGRSAEASLPAQSRGTKDAVPSAR
ncbi:hypothetical protein ACIQM4_30595 [Streptomyces sp. NPDC091272]|uniref:hypothetical protein n=1 Tax=Streptomyces sp. NPDC091272 TaxID=3365981 RepID=UPI0037FC5364